MDREFGRWEKHTSGFGSKMLTKMGWRQGSGLGSGGEGILNPVKAVSHKEFGKGLAHMQVNKVGEFAFSERFQRAYFVMRCCDHCCCCCCCCCLAFYLTGGCLRFRL